MRKPRLLPAGAVACAAAAAVTVLTFPDVFGASPADRLTSSAFVAPGIGQLRGATGEGGFCFGALPLAGRSVGTIARAATESSEDEDDEWNQDWGWNSELGKWVHYKTPIKVWWKQPGFLTPNGYPEPPHWSKEAYKLCLVELDLAKKQAMLVAQLKDRGMTFKEICARANCYEFIEDDSGPKVTDKLKFLFQVQALHRNQPDDELIDVRYVPRYQLPWEDEFEAK